MSLSMKHLCLRYKFQEKKYLRTLPMDPITESTTTWIIVPPDNPEKGAVFDVHSGAEGNGSDGTPYREW